MRVSKTANGSFALLSAGHRHAQLVADMNAMMETQGLGAVEGSGSRQDVAQHGGNQRANPHRRRDWIARRGFTLFSGQHQRIGVARHMREQEEVLHRAGPINAGAGADLQFGPGRISDRGWLLHVNPLGRRKGSLRNVIARVEM